MNLVVTNASTVALSWCILSMRQHMGSLENHVLVYTPTKATYSRTKGTQEVLMIEIW